MSEKLGVGQINYRRGQGIKILDREREERKNQIYFIELTSFH